MDAVENLLSGDLFFDDEPLESILYGKPSHGPGSATAFGQARTLYRKLEHASSSEDPVELDRQLSGLLDESMPLPLWLCAYALTHAGGALPTCPWPVLPRGHSLYGRILERICETAISHRQPEVLSVAGGILYRWYEGLNEFERARNLLFLLIRHAIRKRKPREVAIYTANLGYEFLLDKNWAEAIGWFLQAADLFEDLGDSTELTNMRANVLTCRFSLIPPDQWDELKEELIEVNRTLTLSQDWRARKTLILLARFAESKGRFWSAVNWARRAVSTVDFKQMPTRHHLDDKIYLNQLKHRMQCFHKPD